MKKDVVFPTEEEVKALIISKQAMRPNLSDSEALDEVNKELGTLIDKSLLESPMERLKHVLHKGKGSHSSAG